MMKHLNLNLRRRLCVALIAVTVSCGSSGAGGLDWCAELANGDPCSDGPCFNIGCLPNAHRSPGMPSRLDLDWPGCSFPIRTSTDRLVDVWNRVIRLNERSDHCPSGRRRFYPSMREQMPAGNLLGDHERFLMGYPQCDWDETTGEITDYNHFFVYWICQ